MFSSLVVKSIKIILESSQQESEEMESFKLESVLESYKLESEQKRYMLRMFYIYMQIKCYLITYLQW